VRHVGHLPRILFQIYLNLRVRSLSPTQILNQDNAAFNPTIAQLTTNNHLSLYNVPPTCFILYQH